MISLKIAAVLALALVIQPGFGQTPASPAHVVARKFMRGANCGNYLEVPPNQTWSVPHSTNDLARMRSEGFDHVRIPIGWHHYAGPAPDFRLSSEIFGKVDLLVTNALTPA